MGKSENSWLINIVKLFHLETMTTPGRFNLGALIALIVFALIYTASDKCCYLISAVRDAYKTNVLGHDISDPYQTVSIFSLFVPVIILIIFCFGFLYIHEKKINSIDKNNEQG